MTNEELILDKVQEATQLLFEVMVLLPSAEVPARTHAHVSPHALSLVWDSELKKISRFRESKARCLTAFP